MVMETDQIPEPHELANKPLVEAIFELRWALKDPGSGFPPQDPGFRIALGRYYDRVRGEYPFVKDLPTSQVPEDMTAYAVRHQFRTGENEWPLTQLGPGILTVNETQGYTWDGFLPRLLTAVAAIFESYPSDITPFQPIGVQLRYINALPFDPESDDLIQFLSQRLHTSVTVKPHLFDDPNKPDSPTHLNLNLTFPLKSPPGVGILGFATGLREHKPSIIMEITIRSGGDDVPKRKPDFEDWLTAAHTVVDKWFFTLCRGELLASFESSDGNANP